MTARPAKRERPPGRAPLLFAGFVASALAAGCAGNHPGAILVSGTIEAIEVDVSPEVSGMIASLRVTEGSPVDKGTVVAEIDPIPYDLALKQAEAALRQSEAQLALLTRGYRTEEVREAKEAVEEREAQLLNARTQFSRVERLASDSVASEGDLDTARRDVDVAAAQLRQARERLALLQRGFRVEEIESAGAERDRLHAVMEQRRLEREKTRVVSPLRGIVTARVLEQGEYARVGSSIARVADLAHLYCWVYLSEADLGRIRVGEIVKVGIDAYSGKGFPGRVAYISPEAEFTPKNIQTREERVELVFAVKVLVDNPDGALKIGLPADVEIPVHSAPPARPIPPSAPAPPTPAGGTTSTP